ncbi:MAG: hypothetical protein J7621_28205 [Niastella sp.]|nr:hypothetical protein [Niastella sp.]
MSTASKKHFRDWFENNHESYLVLHTMSQSERSYWMHEIITHLKPCGVVYVDFIFPEDETNVQLIISAGGNHKRFKDVEQLVAEHGIEEIWGHTGIDPYNLWCNFYYADNDEEPGIYVYVDCDEFPDAEFEGAVLAVVENVPGERSACLDIGWITVERLADHDEDGMPALIKLQDLPVYPERMKYSSLCVNGEGRLQKNIAKNDCFIV